MYSREFFLNIATALTTISAVAVGAVVVRREFVPQATVVQEGIPAARTNRIISNWQVYEAGGRRIGPETAPVTIVEFGDFECPACRGFSRTLASVMPQHPRDVALVFRHWPLQYHRFAYPAARASECAADQGKFAEYYQLLYGKQDSLGLISFHALAERARVGDLAVFDKCAASSRSVAAIEAGKEAARQLNAFGTPTLMINGLLLGGVPDSAELEKLIADARLKATQ